jgi:hypothetical protein
MEFFLKIQFQLYKCCSMQSKSHKLLYFSNYKELSLKYKYHISISLQDALVACKINLVIFLASLIDIE